MYLVSTQNIIHDEGLEAMKNWMITNNVSHQQAEFIKLLGKLVLKNHYFEFNGEIYLQKQGTAMGTRMAPNYAIIFMHKIESEILEKTPLKPKFFKRFIDDIFIIWPHGEEKLRDFIHLINNHHPTIKFTEEHSNKERLFFGYTSFQGGQQIKDKSISQEDRPKQYLHYKSCHSLNQKDAVPYGLLIRARRICSKDEDFKTEALSIVSSLLKRGYPDRILLNAFNRVWNKTQSELLLPTQRTAENKIRLIKTFNQRNPPLKQIIKMHESWLDKTKKDIQSTRYTNGVQESKKSETITSKKEDSHIKSNSWIFHQLQQAMYNMP